MLLRRLKSSYVQGLYSQLKHEESFFERTKKFSNFCKNMSKLEQLYSDQERDFFLQSQQLKRYALAGQEPIRDILSYYSKSRKDFSSQLLVDCLENLGGVIASQKTKPYTDIDPREFQNAWQFQYLIHDLKLAFDGKEHMSPIHIGRSLIALAHIGYKDVQLVQMAIARIQKVAEDPSEPFANQVHKEHVYSGFQVSEEFKGHITTLLDWKQKPKASDEEVLVMIENLTEMVHEAKLSQKDLASAIANINEQYYMLVAAQKSNPLLMKNDHVTIGLNHLQELLIEAEVLNPYDLESTEVFEDLDKLMSKAEKTFTNLTAKYFPEVNNRLIDEMYELTKQHSQVELPTLRTDVPNPNTLTAEAIGTYFIGLGKLMHVEQGDVNEDLEYPNVPWHRRAHPIKHELDYKRKLHIALPYTSLWIHSQKSADSLIPVMREASAEGSVQSSLVLLHGMGLVHIYDKVTVSNLCNKIKDHKGDIRAEVEVLANGLYGLGMCNHQDQAGKVLLGQLAKHRQLEDLSLVTLIKVMWGCVALDLQGQPGFRTLFSLLNDTEPAGLSRADNEYFREVMISVEHEAKIPELELSTHLATAKALASQVWMHELNLYDPVKPYLRKLGRYLMTLSMPEEEAMKIQQKVRKAEEFPLFKFDDVITLNGFYTYLFFAGSEAVHRGHVLGPCAVKCKLLKAIGKRGLPIPVNEILEIDYFAPSVKPKDFQIISEFAERFVGIPKNYLEQAEVFAAEYVKLMNEENEAIASNNLALVMLEELVGAFKLQNMARTKTGEHLYSQGLEEVKLQLLKVSHRFAELDEATQARVNALCQQTSPCKTLPELLRQVNSGISLKPAAQSEFWFGARQFMHLPKVRTEGQQAEISDEIVNQKFLLLNDYFQYPDWAKDLNSAYPVSVDMAMYEDGLFNNFFFNERRQQVGNKPDPSLPSNSLKQAVSPEARFKALLSNLKYEIKRNWSNQEIAERILGMDLVEDLIEDHLRPKAAGRAKKLLPRNAEAFAEFMSRQMKSSEDSDQYAKLYREIHAKEASKQEVFKAYTQNSRSIARKSEFDEIEKSHLLRKAKERYVNTKEALDLEDPERGLFFDPIFRQRFGTKSDFRDLRTRVYDIREDPDFLEHASDSAYLDFKRRKAEATLIKTRILFKLHKNAELSPLEQEYLAAYKQRLASASVVQAGKVMVPELTTSLTVGEIKDRDLALFAGLHKVDASLLKGKLADYSASEVVFELAHFIDDFLASRVEYAVVERKALADWGVQADPSCKSKLKPLWNNKGLWWHGNALEEYIFRKSSQYTEKDLKDFMTLFGYDNNKHFKDAKYFQMDSESFNEMMEAAKGSDFQLNFIREWWQRKRLERMNRFTYPDGKFAESDGKILRTWYGEVAQEYRQKFGQYFGIEFDEVKEKDFAALFENCKHLALNYGNEVNLNLFRLVYLHPDIPKRVQEDLYGIVQSLKIPVYVAGLVSTDPVKVRGDGLREEVSDKEWADRLENASINFLPELIHKVMTSK